MTERLALVDSSAFARLGHPVLDPERSSELELRIERGLLAASTPLLLETRAGQRLPQVDAGELLLLSMTVRSERRAEALQLQMRAAHQQLGLPPMDYLVAAIAEDHGVGLLHYDADFERLAAHTDLQVELELLAPFGSLD